MPPSLIVFDLDGTLIDSRRDLANAANALLREYGAAPLEERAVGGMVGEGAGVLVTRVLEARGVTVPHADALARFLVLYEERLLDYTRPYEGIPEAVAALSARVPLAVLTNKPTTATDRLLRAFDLRDAFAEVIGGDSPHGRKPDPAGLLWLTRTCGARPEQTVLVGDSIIDLRTARAAGTRPCLARYGFGFLDLPPGAVDGSELQVEHPCELPRTLGVVA